MKHGYWAALLAAGLAGEYYALRTHKIEPLTHTTRVVLGQGKPWEAIGKGAYLGLWAWFWFHLFKVVEVNVIDVIAANGEENVSE